LGLTGIYRAIQILSISVGQLDLGQHRGGREIRPSLLIERPDVDRTRRSFLTRTVINLSAHGEAYWRVFRDPAGVVTSVRALDPALVYLGRDAFGRRYFDYGDPYSGQPRQRLEPVRDRGRTGDVVHLRLMEVPGLEHGLGPIQSCRAAVTGGLDLAEFSDQWFANADVPTGVLSSNQQLTATDVDRYKERWLKTQGGRRGIAVLGSGLSYEPVLLKPADAQWLESRQFSITDQARLMGIPAPYLLAEINGSSLTYQNLEQVDQTLLKYTIMGYLNVIEDAFSELLPIGESAAFKPWGFLRSDNKTRAQINQIYAVMGVKSREQIAAEEGFPVPVGA
ncbi:MAG: phage portal protein, partial [Actinomycetes bacterium]